MNTTAEEVGRVLIVDDEAPARQRLRDLLLENDPGWRIAEAADGLAAIDALRAERFDMVFLDVQMPVCGGLEVVEQVGADRMPLVVFVTAYDQHALRAFESDAIDYLLKPFSDERFERMLARVQARRVERQSAALGRTMLRMAAQRQDATAYLDRLVVKAEGVTRFLPVAEIEWIESAGVYVTVHLATRSLLHRASMKELAERLDPRRFVRVHRSAIVNIDRVVQLEPISHREFEVVLRSGARTRISRSYRAELERRLGQSL